MPLGWRVCRRFHRSPRWGARGLARGGGWGVHIQPGGELFLEHDQPQETPQAPAGCAVALLPPLSVRRWGAVPRARFPLEGTVRWDGDVRV